MSANLKRKNEDSKRSVFDRLGPDTKSSTNTASASKTSIKMPTVCPSYAKTGYCELSSKCKYDHVKRGKDENEPRSRTSKREKDVSERSQVQSKESETKLRSTVVSKSTDETGKKYRRMSDEPRKSSKNERSPSHVTKKSNDKDKYRSKDKKLVKEKESNENLKEEIKCDKLKVEEKSEKQASKSKKIELSSSSRTSSSSTKKMSDSVLSPLQSLSSKDEKSSEPERPSNKETHLKIQLKINSDGSKLPTQSEKPFSKSKSDAVKKEVTEKREVIIKREDDEKSKKVGNDSYKSTNLPPPSSSSSSKQKQASTKNLSNVKETPVTKKITKMKARHRSDTESSSSSSSSGSSSSSSGSSSGSSSRSSYYSSPERSPNKKGKRGLVKNPTKEIPKRNVEKNEKSKKLSEELKKVIPSSKGKRKHSRDCSKERSHERDDERSHERDDERSHERDDENKLKKSKLKLESSHRRDYSASLSPHFSSPMSKTRDERYYVERNKVDEERYVRSKVADDVYDRDRGSLERSHESRRVKVDQFLDNLSPSLDDRRKNSEYYRDERRDDDFRYRRTDGEYGSLERRRSGERPLFDIPDKVVADSMFPDEPLRRERQSRRSQWEQMEAEELARSKHKRHLSDEGFSPTHKKRKTSSNRDDFRERGDKIYESEGRKREYERDDGSLLDGMSYKMKHHRRSSHGSWHHQSKERRSRRDKSDNERSRERGRDDYYTRSPVGSSECSPRHRSDHSKRGGDYSGYDYDVDRGRRSLSRSSMGSKAPGHSRDSRYYEGKRPVGSNLPPAHFPSSYDYREPYHATPETDMENRSVAGRPGFPEVGKSMYWDEYKRGDGPPVGSSSYRGMPPHSRPTLSQQSTSGPPSDWESGRVVPGKSQQQQSHEWDNRFEKSSEDFRNRRDVLLPPPPRLRLETNSSDAASPVVNNTAQTTIPANNSDQNTTDAPPEVWSPDPMEFEMEGYEEISEEVLDENLIDDDDDEDEREDKDGNNTVADEEEEVENLPKRIPLVDMLDIEWGSLVKEDNEMIKKMRPAVKLSHKVSDMFREIGLSREFAGDELFEKINSLISADADDDSDDDNDSDNDDRIDNKNVDKVDSVNGPATVSEQSKENKDDVIATLSQQTIDDQNYSETTTNDDGDHKVKSEPPSSHEKDDNRDEDTKKLDNFNGSSKPSPPTNSLKKNRLLHDVANFHVTAYLKVKRQASVVGDIGPYRQALCARRDLAMRRTLCRVEKEEIVMFPAQLADQDLYKLSLQLFHQNRNVSQENATVTVA